MELMNRRARLPRGRRNDFGDEDKAILLSTRMLGRWPNDPQIVSAAVRLHSRYIESLFRRSGGVNALKGNERLLGILEILSLNPENSDAIREELIQIQLRRLSMIRRRSAKKEEESLRRKIEKELQHYRGPKREDFLKQLEDPK